MVVGEDRCKQIQALLLPLWVFSMGHEETVEGKEFVTKPEIKHLPYDGRAYLRVNVADAMSAPLYWASLLGVVHIFEDGAEDFLDRSPAQRGEV